MSDDQGRPRMGEPQTLRTMSRTKTVEVPLPDGWVMPHPYGRTSPSIYVTFVTLRWEAEVGNLPGERVWTSQSVAVSGSLVNANGLPGKRDVRYVAWPDSPRRSPWPDWLRRLVEEHRPTWATPGGESRG